MDNRFGFGENWKKYLSAHYSEERAEIARKWLLDFLKLDDLSGLSFLDIGCGSGLHSLGAWNSKARQVTSFDYDIHSVQATQSLHRMAGAPDNWSISQGSVLDDEFCARLGGADIVYSWGVLHHTGDQWKAIANAMAMMGPQSRLYIALYTSDQYIDPTPEYWLALKRRYNQSGVLIKRLMEAVYVWRFVCHRRLWSLLRLPAIARAYKADRGMALMPDVRDWLGGWPMEFSAVREVIEFAKARGLTLVNINTGAANTEYLFVADHAVEALGYTPVSKEAIAVYFSPPVRGVADLSDLAEIFVFGTGRGATVLKRAFEQESGPRIAGFIDLDSSGELEGIPVHSFADFVATFPTDTPIILSNQHVVANVTRLARHGFETIYNGHPLVMAIAARQGTA